MSRRPEDSWSASRSSSAVPGSSAVCLPAAAGIGILQKTASVSHVLIRRLNGFVILSGFRRLNSASRSERESSDRLGRNSHELGEPPVPSALFGFARATGAPFAFAIGDGRRYAAAFRFARCFNSDLGKSQYTRRSIFIE